MIGYRKERDFLGERELDNERYYGIETLRAKENFDLNYGTVHPEIVKALAIVKKSALQANIELGFIDVERGGYIETALEEIINGKFNDEFIVDALQGGAGTALNMNVNEVATNRALELAGRAKGDYSYIHPIETINLHQSTNDVFPTAVRIAAIYLLRELAEAITHLQNTFQKKEKEFANIIKLGRTEMQDAVPMTLGQEFSGYSSAIARDRWRIFKCEERLRVVNLGGTAIGSGITAPKKFIFLVIDKLKANTGLGLSRAENLIDATANMDTFVEVSGIIKAHAVTLNKIASDLRLLSSGPSAGFGELNLKPMQQGSTIMPFKVNPVIPEMVQQVSMKVIANDSVISSAAMNGSLELNPFLPVLSDAFISSLKLLKRADSIFADKCASGIYPNEKIMKDYLMGSNQVMTAMVPYIGYEKATDIISEAVEKNVPAVDLLRKSGIISEEEINRILSPENITALGFKKNNK